MHLVEERGDAVVIHVRNRLDRDAANALSAAIELGEVGAGHRIVVSLERCTAADWAGLSVLAHAHERNGAKFFVVLPNGAACSRSFGVTGLSTLIQIVPNVQNALDVVLGTT